LRRTDRRPRTTCPLPSTHAGDSRGFARGITGFTWAGWLRCDTSRRLGVLRKTGWPRCRTAPRRCTGAELRVERLFVEKIAVAVGISEVVIMALFIPENL
jgi:hypothetical protein